MTLAFNIVHHRKKSCKFNDHIAWKTIFSWMFWLAWTVNDCSMTLSTQNACCFPLVLIFHFSNCLRSTVTTKDFINTSQTRIAKCKRWKVLILCIFFWLQQPHSRVLVTFFWRGLGGALCSRQNANKRPRFKHFPTGTKKSRRYCGLARTASVKHSP